MGRKLYVGNLPFSAGEAELQELFAQAGAVDTVKIMRDMATGRARGFAFVEMATDDDAQKAIDMFNAFSLTDRKLSVSVAKTREAPGGSQSRYSAFGLADRGLQVNTRKPREAPGGYKSRFGAFGNGSNPTKPRRRGGSQRY